MCKIAYNLSEYLSIQLQNQTLKKWVFWNFYVYLQAEKQRVAFLGLSNAFQKLQFLPRALALEAMEVEAVNEGQQLPLVGEEHILIVQRLRDNCATRKSMCC